MKVDNYSRRQQSLLMVAELRFVRYVNTKYKKHDTLFIIQTRHSSYYETRP